MIDHDEAVEAAAHDYLQDPRAAGKTLGDGLLRSDFISPHFPLNVPEPFFSMYYPDNVDLPNNPPGHLDSLPPAAARPCNDTQALAALTPTINY